MTTMSLKSGRNRKTVKNRKMPNNNGGFLGDFLKNFFGKRISSDVLNQHGKAIELQKKGIKVVKTTQMKIGKKYRPVLSNEGSDEFTLKSRVLDDFQPPMSDPNVRITGKTYILTMEDWYITPLMYENEWFIEVDTKPNMKPKTIRMKSNRSRRA